MGVKMDYVSAVNLLHLTLSERSRALFGAVRLNFREGGLEVKQTDDARVIAVLLKVKPDYFSEYSAIGPVVVEPRRILDVLADHFKKSPWIELDVVEEGSERLLTIEGEGVKYSEPLLDVEVPEPNTESIATTGGVPHVSTGDYSLAYLYELDVSLLRGVKRKWEQVWFTATPEGLSMKISYGAGSIERRLRANVLRRAKEVSVTFGVAAEHLALMVKALPPLVKIAVVSNDSGEPGPITFYAEQSKYTQAYLYVPVAV